MFAVTTAALLASSDLPRRGAAARPAMRGQARQGDLCGEAGMDSMFLYFSAPH